MYANRGVSLNLLHNRAVSQTTVPSSLLCHNYNSSKRCCKYKMVAIITNDHKRAGAAYKYSSQWWNKTTIGLLWWQFLKRQLDSLWSILPLFWWRTSLPLCLALHPAGLCNIGSSRSAPWTETHVQHPGERFTHWWRLRLDDSVVRHESLKGKSDGVKKQAHDCCFTLCCSTTP